MPHLQELKGITQHYCIIKIILEHVIHLARLAQALMGFYSRAAHMGGEVHSDGVSTASSVTGCPASKFWR